MHSLPQRDIRTYLDQKDLSLKAGKEVEAIFRASLPWSPPKSMVKRVVTEEDGGLDLSHILLNWPEPLSSSSPWNKSVLMLLATDFIGTHQEHLSHLIKLERYLKILLAHSGPQRGKSKPLQKCLKMMSHHQKPSGHSKGGRLMRLQVGQENGSQSHFNLQAIHLTDCNWLPFRKIWLREKFAKTMPGVTKMHGQPLTSSSKLSVPLAWVVKKLTENTLAGTRTHPKFPSIGSIYTLWISLPWLTPTSWCWLMWLLSSRNRVTDLTCYHQPPSNLCRPMLHSEILPKIGTMKHGSRLRTLLICQGHG